MKNLLLYISIILCTLSSCNSEKQRQQRFINENIEYIAQQQQLQTDIIERSGKVLNPRTLNNDTVVYIDMEDWCSGFFPGSMWLTYNLTNDEKWKTLAEKYTEAIESVKKLTWHHDVGFMIGCSFLNGYRFDDKEKYKDVIVEAARSLSTRFRNHAGAIQSWDARPERDWECPVIIDNMMNLELLFEATRLSGDSTFHNIAIQHAETTFKNHFRSDNSSYHVVDYDLETGEVRHKNTAQGFADESAWARGQAWGLYGYIVCYRYSGQQKYLDQAQRICEFVFTHPNMPADMVPYWDFNAPNIPNEPRDASAAAIMASALYEMEGYLADQGCKETADQIMESLASPQYRAEIGTNGNFIIKHCVGSIPHQVEIDVPLNYADYYFLEALMRKRDIES